MITLWKYVLQHISCSLVHPHSSFTVFLSTLKGFKDNVYRQRRKYFVEVAMDYKS
jgi:hypothetical protein